MGLFDKLFKQAEPIPEFSDDDIVSIGTGEIVDVKSLPDQMFATEALGKTCAFKLSSKDVLCPCNGKVEVVFPSGHAFAIRMADGTGILVHIGIDTVSLNGKGFKGLLKVGDTVKAGQKAVEVDWPTLMGAGLHTSTMLIVSEPVDGVTYSFKEVGPIEKYVSVRK